MHSHTESCDHTSSHKSLLDDSEASERRYYFAVRDSFIHYVDVETDSHQRAIRHVQQLAPEARSRLPPSTDKRLDLVQKGIEENQEFLDEVIKQVDFHAVFPVPPQMMDLAEWRAKCAKRKPSKRPFIEPHNFSKVRSTLRQCVRDWSSEGSTEREQCYSPILNELNCLLPVNDVNINKQRVLVPGAGLGRLVLEIASRGYATQGNEFSYQMLFTSSYILNYMNGKQITIHPYVDDTCNIVGDEDMYRGIKIPDVNPEEMLKGVQERLKPGEILQFSMTAGEWIDVYSNQLNQWDCVVTCFFLDTAPVIMDYIEAIYNILKPGGIWINFGPLQFHWANGEDSDERFKASVELSWDEIKHVIGTYGFEIHKEEIRETTYNCNIRSLLRNVYRAIFFVAVKPKIE